MDNITRPDLFLTVVDMSAAELRILQRECEELIKREYESAMEYEISENERRLHMLSMTRRENPWR